MFNIIYIGLFYCGENSVSMLYERFIRKFVESIQSAGTAFLTSSAGSSGEKPVLRDLMKFTYMYFFFAR